jgi:hypothetical protein
MKCRVRESRLISINEDEGKSTVAGVSAVYQINRGQSRSNQAFGSKPRGCRFESYPGSQIFFSINVLRKRLEHSATDRNVFFE